MKLFLLSLILFNTAFATHDAKSAPPPQERAKASDPFVRENGQKRAQNPTGLNFTIRIKDNRTQFRPGEIVRLELNFSSSVAKTFVLNDRRYDHSGRLDIDDFVLDNREGTADPLYDYFNSGLFGFMGGGGSGMPELSDKPEVVIAELNEWFRFDKPRHYRLYVVSGRVGKRTPEDRYGGQNLTAVSNIVEFEILPADEKWASQQFAEATAALGKRGGDHRPACRTLRFLGTAEAAGEMVKQFRGSDAGCDGEYDFGLISSPHRDLVIRAMERALISPEHPVTSSFIRVLALLAFTVQAPVLPRYPEGNDARIKQWQALLEQRRHSYEQVELNYLRELVTAMPQKQEEARGISLQTLVDYKESFQKNDSAQFNSLMTTMPDVFGRLPLEAQVRLLTYQWEPLATNAMLPVLRQTYEQPGNAKDPYRLSELRSIALLRIYELSPEEGRRLILGEIRRPKPRVKLATLGSLPDQTLSELDDVLAANLEESRQPNGTGDTEAISELIERYATAAIAGRVQAVYESPGVGQWACRIQAALLAYMSRVDPQSGSELLDKALAARGKQFSRCYPSTLSDVAHLHMSAELQEAAYKALEENDPEMVANAAGVLGQFGTAEAEEKLWRRLERWHEQAESRAEDLRKQNPGIPAMGASVLSGEITIEQALRTALSYGQGWLGDPEKLKRLRPLCLSDSCLTDVDNITRSWNHDIGIGLSSNQHSHYLISVAQYQLNSIEALKQKFLKFPQGTAFIWHKSTNLDDEPGEPQTFLQVKSYLGDHGMKLEREPQQSH